MLVFSLTFEQIDPCPYFTPTFLISDRFTEGYRQSIPASPSKTRVTSDRQEETNPFLYAKQLREGSQAKKKRGRNGVKDRHSVKIEVLVGTLFLYSVSKVPSSLLHSLLHLV